MRHLVQIKHASLMTGLVLAILGLCAFGVPNSAQAQSDGSIITLPLDGGAPPLGGLAGEGALELDRARMEFDRHRSNHVEPGEIDNSIVTVLRPIQARGRPAGTAIRFDGERRTLEFAMFVPEPGQVRAMRIATMSSINVLPDRSRYRIYVNDTEIGVGSLGNYTEFEAEEFPLNGASVLQGQNNVRIELIQYHRIYCGPDASFSLWSDIDLAVSGAVLASGEGMTGEDGFLMGLAAAAATGVGVEIRGANMLGDYRQQWISQITRQITRALGGDPIVFRFTNYWSVTEQGHSASRITFIPSHTNRITFRQGGDGAQVMLVEFVPNSRPQALPAFERILPTATREEIPRLIDTQEPVPFSDFGFETSEVRDRYARFDARFRLPDDYIVLTNDKATINLDYIYVDGLPEGAMMLVHVNEHNIRLLPLRGEPGELIEQFPVRFEARELRAGVNSLSFEFLIPGNPGDLPCPTQDTPFAAIADTSTLEVPYSPSMYLADMHLAFTSLTPDSVVTNDMTARAYDENEVVTIAASLVGEADGTRAINDALLHLISVEDLGSMPMGGYQLSRNAVDLALNGPALVEVEVDANGHPDPRPMARTAEQRAELDRRERVARGEDAQDILVEQQTSEQSLIRSTRRTEQLSMLDSAWAWSKARFWSVLQWLHPRAGLRLNTWLERQRGQAILMQLDPARPNEVWMVRSAGADVSSIASAMVAARTISEGPHGQVAILDRNGEWQSWTAPDRQPVLLEPISLSNVRHVVGNFVSAMPIRYVTGLFFLALVSALVALRLVISTREHKT